MKTLKPIFTVALVATALFLAACGSKLTEDNLQKIHSGMTTDEVKTILGEPTEVQTGNAFGLVSSTVYTYHSGSSDVKITFVNDKVLSTEGDFK